MKIEFKSDNSLSLGKMIKIPVCVIIVKSFSKNQHILSTNSFKRLFFEYEHENEGDSYVVC